MFVYGVEATTLTQAPGGRDNAFMVSKATFELLAQPEESGNFFLRPDRILGIFLLDPLSPPSQFQEAQHALESEQAQDQETKDVILRSIRETEIAAAAITKQILVTCSSLEHDRDIEGSTPTTDHLHGSLLPPQEHTEAGLLKEPDIYLDTDFSVWNNPMPRKDWTAKDNRKEGLRASSNCL